MQLKEPRTIIRNLYQRHIEKEENVLYAEKMFVINTVINYLFKDKAYKEVDQFQVARYGEIIHRYLNSEVDIFWQDGILMVRDLENGEQFAGG